MLRRSLDEGKIPQIFKMAYISPIHKGGSKQDPERYRPVSLTSHIAKVFERVIKKKIEKFLVENARAANLYEFGVVYTFDEANYAHYARSP